MGNGNCKQCKCNNCDNEEKNIADNFLEQNLYIIKNDAYESFDNELKNNKDNKYNKIAHPPKNMENEKKTTNNNQENITDNKKEKIEIENNNTINNNDKNETVNNININCNNIENKNNELKEKIEMEKDNYFEEKPRDLTQFENNIHIVSFNSKDIQKNNNVNSIDEIKENIEKKEIKKSKSKINKTRNNNEEFNMINNDLVYITNKNNNINENLYKNLSKESQNNTNNNENEINYDNNKQENNYDNNYNYYDKNNKSNKESNKILNINNIINIYSIIPKNKLLKLNDNSIICNSILEKIIKIPEKKKIIYNERFCVLTKKNFSYYKSKESYLNLTKSLLSIDLKNIIKVEQTILNDNSYYFGLICSINDDTKKYIDKINTFIDIGENNDEEFLLGFRSKNKDLIIKWIVILNYFIDNYE